MSPDSVADLMKMPDVDGALVGGASLVSDSFLKIIQGAAPSTITPSPMSLSSSSSSNSPLTATSTTTKSTTTAFSHATSAYFAIDKLKAKGPRKNADVGQPHDSSRPLSTTGGSISAGAWWCAEGGWPSPTPRVTTEVFYVLDGHACVTDMDGTRHFMGPGDLVILPKGWSGRWNVMDDIHKVWFVIDQPEVDSSSSSSKKAIVQKYKDFAGSQTYLDNGYVGVGCSTCSPGSFPVTGNSLSNTDAFLVLEGVFFLTNLDGTSRRCTVGDTVVLLKGWTGHCDILEPMKRLWVVAE